MKLKDQVAIVTGGGRGIGRAIALRFAAEGAAVTLAATGRDGLEATAKEIRAQAGRALVAVTDVADEAAVQSMVAATVREFGRLDILINNSGIAGPTSPVIEMDRAGWDRTLAVNVTGACLCAKHALPHMIQRKSGRIVNITSIAGRIGYALRSPYAVSKWGMIALTRSLALETGEHGITVNAIAPGVFPSKMSQGMIGKSEHVILDQTPLKRLGGDEDLKGIAVLLASEASAYITGQTIAVDGGMSAV